MGISNLLTGYILLMLILVAPCLNELNQTKKLRTWVHNYIYIYCFQDGHLRTERYITPNIDHVKSSLYIEMYSEDMLVPPKQRQGTGGGASLFTGTCRCWPFTIAFWASCVMQDWLGAPAVALTIVPQVDLTHINLDKYSFQDIYIYINADNLGTGDPLNP